LHRVGFTSDAPCHHGAGALLPHHFTLAGRAVHVGRHDLGGVVSVALSLGFPRVGATDHPALRCPDFPRKLTSLSRLLSLQGRF